jgi:integrase
MQWRRCRSSGRPTSFGVWCWAPGTWARRKTGIYDDAVILNHPSLQWMSALLEAQVRSHPAMTQLWDFDDNEFRVAFVRAAELSGLGHLSLTPYHLRHAGPSWDALTGLRGQREIQRRGRWASQTSVVRYERASQVVGVLQRLPDATLVYLRACETHLAEIMQDLVVPPACPGM